MAIARTKFNINSVMIVNQPFLFLQKKYVTGDIFDKDSCAMTKTRALFNNRRLLAEDDPSCPKINKAKPKLVKDKKKLTANQIKAAAKKAQVLANKEAEEAVAAQALANKETAEAVAAQELADAANEAATGSDADETAEDKPWS